MNELSIFQYEQREVRTVLVDGDPWFVAKDVCDILNLSDVSMSLRHLDDDEKGTSTIGTLGGSQQVSIINEPGLYSLILRSRKSEAKTFKRWITHDVIPSIRKTGAYAPTSTRKQKAVSRSAQYREAASIIKAHMQIAKSLGTDLPMGKAIAVEDARRETGLDFQRLLPLAELKETPIGIKKIAEIAGVKMKDVAEAIVSSGVGKRDDSGKLVITELGKEMRVGSMEPFKSRTSEHAGYQSKWFPSVVVPLIKSALNGITAGATSTSN